MKAILRIKLFLLASLLAFASGSAWATTVTYSITGTQAASVSSGTAPSGASVSYTQTYGTAKQNTGGNSATMTLTGYAGYKITAIRLYTKSNKNAGAGSFLVKAGDTELMSITAGAYNTKWSTSYTQTYEWITPTMTNNAYAIGQNENVVLTLSATTSSLYWEKVELTYEEAQDKTPHGLAFPSDSYEVTEISFTAPTLTNPNNLPVSYASSNTAVATVNSATGAVNVVGYGTTEITATFVGNDTYAAGSASYTLKVKNPNVVLFKQVKSTDDIVNKGTYILGAATPNFIMKLENNKGIAVSQTIQNEEFESSETTEPCELIIEETNGGYKIKQGSNYISRSSSAFSTSATGEVFSISFTSDGNLTLESTSNYKLRCNNTMSNSDKFRWYNTTTGVVVQLYKKQGGAVVPPPLTVADPTLVALGETFDESISVSVQHADATATIYYTTDPAVGTSEENIGGEGWTVWNVTSMTFTETTTLYVVAVKEGVKSNVVSQTYTKNVHIDAPEITPSCEFTSDSYEVMAMADDGVAVYYTTSETIGTAAPNTTDWTLLDWENDETITISATTTIYFVAEKDGHFSEVVSATYTKREVGAPASPTLSDDTKDFYGSIDVMVDDVEEGASVYYTTSAALSATPSTSTWTLWDYENEVLTFNSTTSLWVATYKNNKFSTIVSATYTKRVHTPELTYDAIEFETSTEVIATAQEGTLLYTTDATAAANVGGTGWMVLDDMLTFTATTTLWVVARDTDGDHYIYSDVVSQTFTKLEQGMYVLVTDATQLQEGDKIIFVGRYFTNNTTDKWFAMAAEAANNQYRTITSRTETAPGQILTPYEGTVEFVLGGATGEWTFYDGTGYLAAPSQNQNYLLTQTNLTNNAKATVEIDKNHVAKVTFNNGNRTNLYPNGKSTRFACYASSISVKENNDMYLYRWVAGTPVSIGKTGFSTWYDSQRSLMVPEGVDAYTFVEGAGNALQAVKSFSAGEVIPKDVAVVLFSKEAKEAEKQYAFLVAANETYDNSANLLKGTDEPELVTVTSTSNMLYKLANGKEGVGFYQASADGASFMNGAHKAYLEIPSAMATRPFVFGDNFGEEVTSLMQQLIEQSADGAFDLQGRRVAKPSHGLYIVNGKKMFIK